MKKIVVLGATGSIGDNTFEALSHIKEKFEVYAISANSNVEKMEKLIHQYQPKYAVMTDELAYKKLKNSCSSNCQLLEGMQGLLEIVALSEIDIVITGIVGAAGLLPTLEAIKAGKRIGLANKEPLVMAGKLMIDAAKKSGAEIIPVDSEHSAIFQCLHSGEENEVQKLWLTASGGPFRKSNKEELEVATLQNALNHPTWKMGSKITVDSATLMNKALEIIEAHWLFGVDVSKIDVIVQPSSIIHSMVEFVDGSTLAQMGVPSMQLPVQYALCYPERIKGGVPSPNWLEIGKLELEEPNVYLRKSLDFAFEIGQNQLSKGVIFNAANEVAVQKFLKGTIKFLDIYDMLDMALNKFEISSSPALDEIIEVDGLVRKGLS